MLLILLTAVGLLTGCSGASSPNERPPKIEGTKFTNVITVARQAKITQTYSSSKHKCQAPKLNCFEVVIIEAPKGTQLAALDAAIQNGTTGAFFANSSNYNTIWTSFESSTVLADLQSEITLLRKADSSASGVAAYYCVDSLGNPVDYSND